MFRRIRETKEKG